MLRVLRVTAVALACALSPAIAQTPASTPAPVPTPAATPPQCAVLFGGGSPDVLMENSQAGRTGDGICIEVIDGARSVFTNGRPALRVGDRVRCPDGRIGVVDGGASSVFIEGRPAATAKSRIRGCS